MATVMFSETLGKQHSFECIFPNVEVMCTFLQFKHVNFVLMLSAVPCIAVTEMYDDVIYFKEQTFSLNLQLSLPSLSAYSQRLVHVLGTNPQ